MNRLVLLFLFFSTGMFAQERAAHIFLGMPIGMLGEGGEGLKAKPGFAIGLGYWLTNSKGNAWSLGASYGSFKRKNETQKETFEYLTLRVMPFVWQLDKKKKWYFEGGIFGNYLLHQEFQDGGAVVNSTKLIQRTYLGPSCGFGIRLGEEGRSRILLGIRDDFGILAFGKGSPLKFNTITLFAGLEI
ncbi:MAG: hypothetical protein ACKVU0_17535 [Saprospiraceae bacterium]